MAAASEQRARRTSRASAAAVGLRWQTLGMTVAVLPVRRTALIGRTEDLAAIAQRLEDAPVVALTGMGGVGKTSLAFETAAQVADAGTRTVYPVALMPVTEPEAVQLVGPSHQPRSTPVW